MNKILFLDTETTGLDPNKNGIIQVAMLTEDGCELNMRVNPGKKVKYDKEALKINGIKKKQIKKFPKSKEQFKGMIKWLETLVVPFDPKDKLIVVGYNVKFDVEMLHGWARREKFKYMGSYLDWRVIDVLVLTRMAHYLGQLPEEPENFKLGTICKVFGIDEPTHDAMDDVYAVRAIFYKLVEDWK